MWLYLKPRYSRKNEHISATFHWTIFSSRLWQMEASFTNIHMKLWQTLCQSLSSDWGAAWHAPLHLEWFVRSGVRAFVTEMAGSRSKDFTYFNPLFGKRKIIPHKNQTVKPWPHLTKSCQDFRFIVTYYRVPLDKSDKWNFQLSFEEKPPVLVWYIFLKYFEMKKWVFVIISEFFFNTQCLAEMIVSIIFGLVQTVWKVSFVCVVLVIWVIWVDLVILVVLVVWLETKYTTKSLKSRHIWGLQDKLDHTSSVLGACMECAWGKCATCTVLVRLY